MSGYNIEYFLRDFANRTIKNLRFIETKAETKYYDVYEVTQLINSLLGLIIIPVEAYKKIYRINDNNLKHLSRKDYDIISSLLNVCKKQKRLYSDYPMNEEERQNDRIAVSKFITHLRNAIAHGGNYGIHFYPVSESGQITSVIFYDNNEVRNSHEINEFCIKLSITELKTLVESISNLYCRFEKRDTNIIDKQEKYNSDIRKLEGLLQYGRPDKAKVIFEFEEREIL